MTGPTTRNAADPAGTRAFPTGKRDLDHLFSAAYEELRRLAASVKYSRSNITISPSTLVHETWLKLAKSRGLAPESTVHFKHIAAQAMRQVLVEAARRRSASKRGGADRTVFVTFDDSLGDDRD